MLPKSIMFMCINVYMIIISNEMAKTLLIHGTGILNWWVKAGGSDANMATPGRTRTRTTQFWVCLSIAKLP
jgi:hypothetical protein